jgi:hypothetical protein
MLCTIRETAHIILIACLFSTIVMARDHASNIDNNMATQPQKKVTLDLDTAARASSTQLDSRWLI